MTRRPWAPLAQLLVLSAAAAAATPARAYVRSEVPNTNICLFWDERDLSWSAARGDAPDLPMADALQVFARSFRTWEDVACTDLTFRAEGEVDTRDVGFDEGGGNENVLLFRANRCEDVVAPGDPCVEDEDCANRHDCWDFPDSVIAVTTTTFSQVTGEIVDADIEFNAAAFRFTVDDGSPCRTGQTQGCVSTDLENTATHEIGHFLGLDHSPVRSATMFASAPEGETSKRTLASDDVEGICAIYPAGEATSVCVNRRDLSNRTAGSGCNCSSAGGVGLEALLALVPALRGLRRRRADLRAGSR